MFLALKKFNALTEDPERPVRLELRRRVLAEHRRHVEEVLEAEMSVLPRAEDGDEPVAQRVELQLGQAAVDCLEREQGRQRGRLHNRGVQLAEALEAAKAK